MCKKPLVIGVEHRVDELANKPEGFKPDNAKPFYSILPLQEIIAVVRASTLTSKKVWETYNGLIQGFGNELNILLRASREELAKATNEKMA